MTRQVPPAHGALCTQRAPASPDPMIRARYQRGKAVSGRCLAAQSGSAWKNRRRYAYSEEQHGSEGSGDQIKGNCFIVTVYFERCLYWVAQYPRETEGSRRALCLVPRPETRCRQLLNALGFNVPRISRMTSASRML